MSKENLYKVLLAPHVSEKVSRVEAMGQYVFKVVPYATKPMIRSAVQMAFGVKVMDVRVCQVKGKSKRFGRIEGKRKGWKKAYVTLQEGQRIDLTAEAN
ncbi:MAG: 50S ribosomal protein L23 [Gammaproteobacteria bacterium]|nr:50S ribosomal protein L23 [Gammaproteobacteria bacterium]